MTSGAIQSSLEGTVALLRPAVGPSGPRPAPEQAVAEIDAAIELAHQDRSCRALLLDLAGDPALELGEAAPSQRVEHARTVQGLCDRLNRGGKPAVAAVRGELAGAGLDLALSCHVIFASEDAAFRFGAGVRGPLTGFGGLSRLIRRAGPALGAGFALGGAALRAPELQRLGLVEKRLLEGDCLPEALAFARRCASLDPAVVEALLESLTAGHDLPLDDALELEAQLAGLAAARAGGS